MSVDDRNIILVDVCPFFYLGFGICMDLTFWSRVVGACKSTMKKTAMDVSFAGFNSIENHYTSTMVLA